MKVQEWHRLYPHFINLSRHAVGKKGIRKWGGGADRVAGVWTELLGGSAHARRAPSGRRWLQHETRCWTASSLFCLCNLQIEYCTPARREDKYSKYFRIAQLCTITQSYLVTIASCSIMLPLIPLSHPWISHTSIYVFFMYFSFFLQVASLFASYILGYLAATKMQSILVTHMVQ